MTTVVFRFYGELNAFLAPWQRGRDFAHRGAAQASLKHRIEALGVPHTEVDMVLVGGAPAGFAHVPADGERVAVYPAFRALCVDPAARLREPPARPLRFIADAHLGGLARLLRMAGFDTLYDNHFHDRDIEAIAARQARVVLSRDRELLKRRTIVHGCYVHALAPAQQLSEVARRFGLAASARPFALCLDCNAPLRGVDKAAVLHRLPEQVRNSRERFSTCDACQRVFWEGSHWQRMRALLAHALEQ